MAVSPTASPADGAPPGAGACIVPFAGVLSPAGREALRELRLPGLAAALAACGPLPAPGRPVADAAALDPELTLSPPHETALAAALGLQVADGQVPLAALRARRAGLPGADRAWGRLTPAHWRLGTEQVSMLDPAALRLDAATAEALLQAVRPLFESEGFELHAVAPGHWLAAHPALEGLPCASLDRVIGRNVDLWLGSDPRARLVRRLQNEVQMLLYTHPVNAAREERGELPVNSFWLDGCGRLPPGLALGGVAVDERLRAPALAEDWSAWMAAWTRLDAELLAPWAERARAGLAGPMTLCGERHAIVLRPGGAGGASAWWRRLRAAWRPTDPRALLEAL